MVSDSQDAFAYSDAELITFEKYVSSERLAAFVIYARGDKWAAIRLYERNLEISEALYGVIQGLEVTLRNAIHALMTKNLGTEEWYEPFGLEESERQQIEQAKAAVIERTTKLTPGRVVAELKFGFWVRLFSHAYDKTLWVPHLRTIFPIKFDNARTLIHGRLVDLKTLRNRIAHHERITCGKRDVEKDYAELLETIGWLSKPMRCWVEGTNCFPERFAKKLPKKVRAEQPTST